MSKQTAIPVPVTTKARLQKSRAEYIGKTGEPISMTRYMLLLSEVKLYEYFKEHDMIKIGR